MATASQIVAKLGGRKPLADALNIPYTTVQGWEVANSIPEWRHPALLAFAAEKGKKLSAADFPVRRKAGSAA